MTRLYLRVVLFYVLYAGLVELVDTCGLSPYAIWRRVSSTLTGTIKIEFSREIKNKNVINLVRYRMFLDRFYIYGIVAQLEGAGRRRVAQVVSSSLTYPT